MNGPSRRTVLRSLGSATVGLSLAGCVSRSPLAAETDSLVRWQYSTGSFLDQYVDFDPETCYNCDGVNAPPAVVDDTVYVASDRVYALDAADGDEQWTADTRTPVDAITRRNDTVYAVSGVEDLGGEDYALYSLDAATGDERWQYAPQNPGTKLNLLGVGDAVYVGTSSDVVCSSCHSIYAADSVDGTEQWGVESAAIGLGDGAIGEDTFYIAGEGVVFAFAADDGELRWRVDEYGRASRLVLADDRLYIEGSGVSALDPADGATTWNFEPAENYVTEWAFTADSIVAGADSGTVYELDAETGERRWTVATDDRLHSLAANGEFVFTGTISTGNHERTAVLRAIDATDGTEVWMRTPVGTFMNEGGIYSLVVENGRVYASIATDEGDTAILSLDAATGEDRWRFEPDDGFLTPPTITDTGAYVGSENGDVYALPK